MLKRREDLRTERPGVVPEEELATMRAQRDRRRDAAGVAAAAVREAEGAVAEAEAGLDGGGPARCGARGPVPP